MDELKTVLHEIVDHLHHLTPAIRGGLHAKVDAAGGQGAAPAAAVTPPPAPPQA